METIFCPIASGSNGNCIYIGNASFKILIDAGLSGKAIESGLNALDTTGSELDAIFITHEHVDHISGAGVMSRRYNIPIYATQKTWRFFERHNTIGKIAEENKRLVKSDTDCFLGDLCVRPFEIPHDASEPVGYSVFFDDKKISVATDIGYATETIKQNIYNSDAILLESNHDLEMLMNGRYPQQLKTRIMGNRGHLSNANAGLLLSEIANNRLKHVFLGHLSEENNFPLLAFDTVQNVLTANKIKVPLQIAERGGLSECYVL